MRQEDYAGREVEIISGEGEGVVQIARHGWNRIGQKLSMDIFDTTN